MSVPLDGYTTHFVFAYATYDSLKSYEVKQYRELVPTSTDYSTTSCNIDGRKIMKLCISIF